LSAPIARESSGELIARPVELHRELQELRQPRVGRGRLVAVLAPRRRVDIRRGAERRRARGALAVVEALHDRVLPALIVLHRHRVLGEDLLQAVLVRLLLLLIQIAALVALGIL
jgi:hypothetical protein